MLPPFRFPYTVPQFPAAPVFLLRAGFTLFCLGCGLACTRPPACDGLNVRYNISLVPRPAFAATRQRIRGLPSLQRLVGSTTACGGRNVASAISPTGTTTFWLLRRALPRRTPGCGRQGPARYGQDSCIPLSACSTGMQPAPAALDSGDGGVRRAGT
jgi:hypothetical protein